MTNELNKFEVGDEVVFVSTHWGRRLGLRKKVAKVYKNGNFLLEGSPDKQWRPNSWKGSASRAGQRNYHIHEHLEKWDEEKHGNELKRVARQREDAAIIDNVTRWVKGRVDLTDEQRELIAKLLATKIA